jgi:hypothetical protein
VLVWLAHERFEFTMRLEQRRRAVERQVRAAIDSRDERGAWLTRDKLRYRPYTGPIVDKAVAVRNLNLLADYLAGTATVSASD